MYTVFPFYSFLLSIQFIHLASLTGRPRFNRDTRCRPNIFLWTVAYPAPQGSVTHSEKSAIWHLQHTWPHDWIFTLWSTGSQLSHPANSAAMASNAGWGFVGIQTQNLPKMNEHNTATSLPSFFLADRFLGRLQRKGCLLCLISRKQNLTIRFPPWSSNITLKK